MADAKDRSLQLSLRCLGILLFFSLLASPLLAVAAEIEYTVSFQGIEDNNLLKDLKKSSGFVNQKGSAPLSRFFLLKRAEQQLPGMLEICNAHGYYQAFAEVELSKQAENAFEVIFGFDPGPVYQLADIQIEVEPSGRQPGPKLLNPDELGIPKGSPALAEKILQAKTRLQQSVRSQGYLQATLGKPEVRVDSSKQSVAVAFSLRPGPLVKLGSTTIQGLDRVDPEYVLNMIPWKQGDTYDPKLIQEFKTKLMTTNLFNMVKVEFAKGPTKKGLLPVRVRVRERDQRSVRLGLGFETDIGPLGKAAWEHKNFLGQGERLSVSSNLSREQQTLSGAFEKPNFFRPDQSLRLFSSLIREDYDSYQSTALQAEANIRRQLTPEINLSGGVGYKGQTIKDAEGSNRFHLLFFPGRIEWDSRDALLNPTQGMQIGLGLTPYQNVNPADLTFFKSTLTTKWYQSLSADKNLILALRAKIGSISGAVTEDVPADERFYAGGGGSVRGYPFQEISPQQEGDPFGGRSILEVSSEIRWKMWERFGLAFFLDGGQVTKDPLPDVSDDIFWGAGLGLRYYTDLGPLRLDVAFPLNKEQHIDDSWQFYISIGQAF